MISGYKLTLTNDDYTNAYKVINRDQFILIKLDGTKEILNEIPKRLKFKTSVGEEVCKNTVALYNNMEDYFDYLISVIYQPVMEFVDTAKELYGDRFLPICNVHPFTEYMNEKPSAWVFHFGIYDSVDQLFYLCPVIVSHYKDKTEPNFIPTDLSFVVINSLYNKFIYRK